jgi:hypothetical protein
MKAPCIIITCGTLGSGREPGCEYDSALLDLEHHKPQSTCFDLAHVYCARDKADGGLGIVAAFNTRSNIDNDPPKHMLSGSLLCRHFRVMFTIKSISHYAQHNYIHLMITF